MKMIQWVNIYYIYAMYLYVWFHTFTVFRLPSIVHRTLSFGALQLFLHGVTRVSDQGHLVVVSRSRADNNPLPLIDLKRRCIIFWIMFSRSNQYLPTHYYRVNILLCNTHQTTLRSCRIREITGIRRRRPRQYIACAAALCGWSLKR